MNQKGLCFFDQVHRRSKDMVDKSVPHEYTVQKSQ